VETDARAQARWAVSWPLFAIGTLGVISGGLVAAATAPSPSEHGSWAAAYLVLVVGVAQIALGAGQAALAAHPPSRRLVDLQTAGWNVANALVIVGTLADVNALVYVGGALLVVVLAMFGYGVREKAELVHGRRTRWPLYAFRGLVLLLLVSIPTGLVLATVRGGRS
jgi:NADH:ubiquinone oxidoreductase subunit 6 (subunit J)